MSEQASRVRAPAVAGLFYPDDAYDLRIAVRSYLDEGTGAGIAPKALIVPHAGFVYSGPVAASAYRTLARAAGQVERVVLAGIGALFNLPILASGLFSGAPPRVAMSLALVVAGGATVLWWKRRSDGVAALSGTISCFMKSTVW